MSCWYVVIVFVVSMLVMDLWKLVVIFGIDGLVLLLCVVFIYWVMVVLRFEKEKLLWCCFWFFGVVSLCGNWIVVGFF